MCKAVRRTETDKNLTYGEETFLELHVERILEAKEEMNPIIEQIVEMEWEMFQNVRNTGGRVRVRMIRDV